MNGWHLSTFPLSARVFCTLFLVGIGCGALAAFVQASTAVGLSPAAVEASLAREMPMTQMQMHHGQMSGEKEITLDDISSAAKVWIRTPLQNSTSPSTTRWPELGPRKNGSQAPRQHAGRRDAAW